MKAQKTMDYHSRLSLSNISQFTLLDRLFENKEFNRHVHSRF
jgi:hypothetical protein